MKTISKLMLALMLTPVLAITQAAAATFQEGESYQLVVPPQPTSDEKKIEVVEIFSYLCPHCHRFQPLVDRWLKNAPDNVVFVRMPAIFNQNMLLYARAYYAADALDVLDDVHMALFDAIHREKRRLNTADAIGEVFVENGVAKKDFEKAFRSFAVESKVRRAMELTRRYAIAATPSIIVNGKYRLDPGMPKTAPQGTAGMFNVTDYLIKLDSSGS